MAALDASQLETLARAATLERFRRGAVVFDVDDPAKSAKVMVDGVVGEFGCGADGTAVLMKVFTSPGLFGDMELFWGWSHFHRAEALTDATVAFLPELPFKQALRANAQAGFLMTKDIAGCVALLSYQLQATLFLSIEVRLANFFLAVAKAGSITEGGQVRLQLRLSQPMLARCLGATDRSIARTFAKWRKEGWLRLLPRGGHEFRSLGDLIEHADPSMVSLVRRPPIGEEFAFTTPKTPSYLGESPSSQSVLPPASASPSLANARWDSE